MLQNYDWELTSQFNTFGIFRNRQYEMDLMAPFRNDYKDSERAIFELLNQLSIIYGKTINEIISEYHSERRNKIKLRIIGQELEGGVIPFNQGVKLLENTKEMIIASYLATNNKRKNYLGNRPEYISEHLDKIELGQTEIGSYIINVYLPAEPDDTDIIQRDPISTRAIKQLEVATESLKLGIARFSNTQDYGEFDGLEKQGVSSNLCLAINEIGNDGKNDVDINIQYDSKLNEVPLVSKIFFKKEDIQVIKSVGLLYRQDLTEPNFTLIGYVIDLHREKHEVEGDITLATEINKKKKNVRIHLQYIDYQEAVKAHETSKRISITGTLVTHINKTSMTNVSIVQVVSDEINDQNDLF